MMDDGHWSPESYAEFFEVYGHYPDCPEIKDVTVGTPVGTQEPASKKPSVWSIERAKLVIPEAIEFPEFYSKLLMDIAVALDAAVEEWKESATWIWQGDGSDDLKSLTCPIIIMPDQLRQIVDKGKQEPKQIPMKCSCSALFCDWAGDLSNITETVEWVCPKCGGTEFSFILLDS
jgi:hypothetical protein